MDDDAAMFEDAQEFAQYHRETFMVWLAQRRERAERLRRRADTAERRVLEFARRVGGSFSIQEAMQAAERTKHPTNTALRRLVEAGALRVVGTRPAPNGGPAARRPGCIKLRRPFASARPGLA